MSISVSLQDDKIHGGIKAKVTVNEELCAME